MFTTAIAQTAPTLAAHGMHWGGPFWPFALLGPLVWIALIVTAVLLFRRGMRRRPFLHAAAAGESALATRYANGEIDEQEYRARLAVLRAERDARPQR